MTDKWGSRLFKAGTAALLVLGLVHSLSLIRERVPANDTERQLLGLMANYRFSLMGSLCSMADLLQGFSASFALAAFYLGVLSLLLRRERADLLKGVALVNTLWLGAMTAVSLHYFFAAPTSFLVAGLLIFGLAWLKLPAEENR